VPEKQRSPVTKEQVVKVLKKPEIIVLKKTKRERL
jgi:hypothetical protein